nr:putative ribonuclease H-like domain-containing protein [Tanacetum cinerariifolium]
FQTEDLDAYDSDCDDLSLAKVVLMENLSSCDPEVFSEVVQIVLWTDNGTEFVNQTLKAYYEEFEISHQTLVARTPQQNGVVERWNHTLVEYARAMLIFLKAPLFL